MAMPIRRLSIAPALELGHTAEGPAAAAHHAASGTAGGGHFIAVLNAALQELDRDADPSATRVDPASDVRAAYGPLVVSGVVLPGLRFGS